VPVSVIIPTWRRLDDLQVTLARLDACDPAPAETIVHVDAGDDETAPWLRAHRPDVRVLVSDRQVGAPGGRNKLMAAAAQPYVASFDDDSFPQDEDYFARVVWAFEAHPRAGVLATLVTHRNEPERPAGTRAYRTADFIGCGCALRRAAWHETTGYIDRPLASQGVEEPDLALQLLDRGWYVVLDERLRVFHNTELRHHDSPRMTAGALANRALLAYLRYPRSYAWLGLAQYLSRIVWSLRHGRTRGLLRGLAETPCLLWKHRHDRRPVRPDTLRAYRALQQGAS
jgi:GT2 family glycosyltransferase